ncbi:hypothetical protein [Tateyamaria sp. SN6-1]|uniref:hypothetical protein n=1 Tax=Tateyamaria sp. SN6-1 TaxID=3092148 RepID=UPI0039F4C04F
MTVNLGALAARLIALSTILAMASTLADARSLVSEAEVAGERILIFDDGFWRYSDDQGERCTAIAHVGELCALPSSWAPFPQTDTKALRPVFVRDTIEGFVTSLTPIGEPIGSASLNRAISELADISGTAPTLLQEQPIQLGEFTGTRIVYNVLARVIAFSIVDQNGRLLIFKTQRNGFTLFHRDHQTAHEDLMNKVNLEAFDG